MALVRVAQYNSTPTVVEDYQAQNAHLQAFTNQLLTQQFILDSGTAKPVIKQGAYVSHGGSLYVADADTSITGSPSDGSVYIRVSGTTSLTVEFVTDISGYVWNPVYTALTSGSYTLLPYLIVKAGTVWTRYNFNPNNQSFSDTRVNSLAATGAIYGASLGTTGSAYVGGTLRVTGAISGASINTGLGAFQIGQNLRTTDNVIFNNIEATGSEGTRSAGSYVCFSRTSASTVSSSSYTRAPGYAFKFKKSGIYTVIFRMQAYNSAYYSYARIYVNGSAVGTERSLNEGNSSTFSQNITLQAPATLEIRAKGDYSDVSTTIEWCYINQNEEGALYG